MVRRNTPYFCEPMPVVEDVTPHEVGTLISLIQLYLRMGAAGVDDARAFADRAALLASRLTIADLRRRCGR
jgi:hypothetical protein